MKPEACIFRTQKVEYNQLHVQIFTENCISLSTESRIAQLLG